MKKKHFDYYHYFFIINKNITEHAMLTSVLMLLMALLTNVFEMWELHQMASCK